jgi:hypothetical protein
MAVGVRHRLAVVAVTVASVLVWIALREQLTEAVGGLARVLVALAGHATDDARPDVLAIIVARGADGVGVVRGTTLERWHVNLIVVPILVVAFGPASWGRRLVLGVAALGLVALGDALSAIAFVALQSGGGDPAVRQTAMRGLAVYGSKLVPLIVLGFLAVIASWWSRRLRRPTVEDT